MFREFGQGAPTVREPIDARIERLQFEQAELVVCGGFQGKLLGRGCAVVRRLAQALASLDVAAWPMQRPRVGDAGGHVRVYRNACDVMIGPRVRGA